MTTFWHGKRVITTGGAGFLGRHLCAALEEAGATVFVPERALFDLRTETGVREMFLRMPRPDVLFHLAANVGGIGANQRYAADFYHDNVLMDTLVLEAARQWEVQKFVGVGSVCAYPCNTPAPFNEKNIWEGYPEPTNAPYGIAKRGLLTYIQALRQQYHFPGIILFPTNLYGPGDNFNPETSHVIPALIRKFVEAKATDRPSVEVWGSGKASRDFLYVADAVRALMLAAEKYDAPDPVNIGTGEEILITTLVEILKRLTLYQGVIQWNQARPDGQPKRVLSSARAYGTFGWRPTVSFEQGLRETINYYYSIREG